MRTVSARLVADREGRYVDGNAEALALFGVSLDELCAARIGHFSGPHAELARTVWKRLAGTGVDMPVGESTVYRPDGSQVRVRYTRIALREDGCYELDVVPVDGESDAPPAADRPTEVLREWRAAERDVETGGEGAARPAADGLRELYQHSLSNKQRKDSDKDSR